MYINEAKDYINMSFIDFVEDLASIMYETYYFDDELNKDNLIKMMNIFNETDVQRLFISLKVFDYLNIVCKDMNDVHKRINTFEDKIPLGVYLILKGQVCCRDTEYFPEITKIINQITIDDVCILNFAVTQCYIPPALKSTVVDKLLDLYFFNKDDLYYIHHYFNINVLEDWLYRDFPLDKDKDVIRRSIIQALFSRLYNTNESVMHRDNNIKNTLINIQRCFSKELIYNNIFIYGCCYHNLLTKDFINQVYNANINVNSYKNTFITLVNNAVQHTDYIKSLVMIDTLSERS